MKQLIIILVSSIAFLSANAQTTKELLSNKDWCIEGTNGYITGLRFEGNEVTSFIEYEGRHEKKCLYYFSDTKATAFDDTKVGTKTTGRYIIIKSLLKDLNTNQWKSSVLPLKINRITEDRLELITPVTGNVIVHYAK